MALNRAIQNRESSDSESCDSNLAIPRSLSALIGCSRAAKRGGFPIWTCPSFFVPFCPFWDFPDFSGIFPICSGMVRGFSRFVLFLFLGLLRAPTRNSPERVRDTIRTFPEKVGNTRVWKPPRFSYSQDAIRMAILNRFS